MLQGEDGSSDWGHGRVLGEEGGACGGSPCERAGAQFLLASGSQPLWLASPALCSLPLCCVGVQRWGEEALGISRIRVFALHLPPNYKPLDSAGP